MSNDEHDGTTSTSPFDPFDDPAYRAIVSTMAPALPIAGRVDESYWRRMECENLEAMASSPLVGW